MSFKNRWTISSSYNFQAHLHRSQVLPGLSPALLGAPRLVVGAPRCSQTYQIHSHHTPVSVIRDPSNSEGQPQCPPTVWHSPEIVASKFTLHILSDTPGGSQWLKYILLMWSQIWHCTHILFWCWFRQCRHSLFTYNLTPGTPLNHVYPLCITFQSVAASTQSVIFQTLNY